MQHRLRPRGSQVTRVLLPDELQKSLFLYHQSPHQSNEDYLDAFEFEALWDSFEAQGGCAWKQPSLVEDRAEVIAQENDHAEQPNNADVNAAEEWVKTQYKAALILSGAGHARHNQVQDLPGEQIHVGPFRRVPRRHNEAAQPTQQLQGRASGEL